ncbi:MAG: class IV adenylate cyclase [Planctomycetota bacterium]|nr:class IV adenylate cyclase [Planctomycetota bacterium]
MIFEVEQKFEVAQPDALAARLVELGGHFDQTVCQVDQYFAHPARDFATTDEALRIRRVGDVNFLTYKGPKIDAETKTRREIDLPLPPGAAAAEQFTELLSALGFRSVAQVKKSRRPGRIEWNGWQVETAIDDVEGLGPYAELEVTASEPDVAAGRACIQSLAQRLDLTENERRSYLELLLAR